MKTSVVLFSLLLFSGMGSYLSGRFASGVAKRAAATAAVCVIGLGLVSMILLTPLFDNLIGIPLLCRAAIAVGALLPLGLAMGMPFPLGIKLAEQRDRTLVPWLWGMNGATSVVGSVLAMLVAINLGFDATLLTGLASYCAAAMLLLLV